jgi:hypothetical protein
VSSAIRSIGRACAALLLFACTAAASASTYYVRVTGTPGPTSSCTDTSITFAFGATASWFLKSPSSLIDITVAGPNGSTTQPAISFGSASGSVDLSLAGAQTIPSTPRPYSATITLQPEDYDTDGATVSFTCDANGKIVNFSTGVVPGVTPNLQASPSSVNFPATAINATTAATTVTVTNTGTADAVGVSFSNSNPGEFLVSNNTCGATIAKNASCSLAVAFKPSGGGARAANLAFTGNGGITLGISVRGTGLTDLAVPTTLTFGNQSVGTTSAAQVVTITNNGSGTVNVTGVTSDNATEFPLTNNCGSLAPAASCTVNVSFKPAATGTRTATITVTSTGAGSPQAISVSGTGTPAAAAGQLSFQSSVSFGSQTVGTTSAANNVTVTNTGGTAVAISSIASSAPAEFGVSAPGCTTLNPGANCTIAITFTPAATGARSATVTVTSNGLGSPQAIAVNGTGAPNATAGQLSLPQSVSFGSQNVGTSSAASVIPVTNTGGTAVAVSGVTSSNPAEFAVTTTCANVAPGAQCTISVTFSPTATGARNASITVTSNGTGSPQAIAASGTGASSTQPGQLSFPGVLQLPDTNVGSQSATTVFTVTNVGGTPVTVTGVTSNAATFVIASDSCSGAAVQPGASCQVGVAFKPTATGPASATITVNSDGAGNPQTLTVTANGLAGGMNIDQQGLTGSWYQPVTSGQGIEIEVYPNLVNASTGFLQGSWFTYDTTAVSGPAGQRWYTFSGNAPAGSPGATLTIYQNVGGNFNAAPITTVVPVGTANITFSDCTNASFTYSFTDGRSSGVIPLVRLTPNVTCVMSGTPPANVDFGYSGNWYDPATSGQGLVVELNPNASVVFFAWYTYAPNGQAAGAAGQRWYTGQATYTLGSRTLQTTLYETTGGVLNSATPAPQTVAVGTATLQFTACNAAKLTFNFTGGSSAGQSGTINLQRVGPVPAACQ